MRIRASRRASGSTPDSTRTNDTLGVEWPPPLLSTGCEMGEPSLPRQRGRLRVLAAQKDEQVPDASDAGELVGQHNRWAGHDLDQLAQGP